MPARIEKTTLSSIHYALWNTQHLSAVAITIRYGVSRSAVQRIKRNLRVSNGYRLYIQGGVKKGRKRAFLECQEQALLDHVHDVLSAYLDELVT